VELLLEEQEELAVLEVLVVQEAQLVQVVLAAQVVLVDQEVLVDPEELVLVDLEGPVVLEAAAAEVVPEHIPTVRVLLMQLWLAEVVVLAFLVALLVQRLEPQTQPQLELQTLVVLVVVLLVVVQEAREAAEILDQQAMPVQTEVPLDLEPRLVVGVAQRVILVLQV